MHVTIIIDREDGEPAKTLDWRDGVQTRGKIAHADAVSVAQDLEQKLISVPVEVPEP